MYEVLNEVQNVLKKERIPFEVDIYSDALRLVCPGEYYDGDQIIISQSVHRKELILMSWTGERVDKNIVDCSVEEAMDIIREKWEEMRYVPHGPERVPYHDEDNPEDDWY